MATNPLGALGSPLFNIVGFGVGTAVGPLLRPPIQDLVNEAWTLHPVRPLSAETAAAMVVEGVWTPERAATEAGYTGVSGSRLDALRALIDDPPDINTMYALWRRNLIDTDRFIEGLRHHRIETTYFEALRQLHNVLLSPDQLANARQRGFMSAAEQHAEAALQGVTAERADVQFQLSGLPPPPERAREMWRRGIITQAEFEQAIVEGNEKLKYVDEEVALYRPLLTPATIVNQRLRGWRDTAWMDARLAEHGYSTEQANDLFEGQGRPISFRQVFIGERRGGAYEGSTAPLSRPFLKSLQESNIRPEWYALAWAQRHSLPSAFVLRALTQGGDITEADAERLLLWSGWPEDLAAKVSAAWATGGTDGTKALTKAEYLTEFEGGFIDETEFRARLADLGFVGRSQDLEVELGNARRVISSRNRALLALEKRVTKGSLSGAEAASFMTELEIPEAARAQLLEVWDIERRIAAA